MMPLSECNVSRIVILFNISCVQHTQSVIGINKRYQSVTRPAA
ncbi:hypothetical protein LSH36_655g00034 [Paralvinella palmiformis]|uniref:Uncharacterized protein n=1 Tax=Paralvinella palmiformis TaxID=53620 RepID=A0AAD9J3Q7_9ANNE|nr:hypothetical protein LSH36_655g00034 [Paralvinella palmiformis]